MAKGRDWNDLHRENPGAIRAINDDPAEDIPFDVCDLDYEPPGETWGNGEAQPAAIKLLTYAEMVVMPAADWLIDFILQRRGKKCSVRAVKQFQVIPGC
jgi:hypothetical protein